MSIIIGKTEKESIISSFIKINNIENIKKGIEMKVFIVRPKGTKIKRTAYLDFKNSNDINYMLRCACKKKDVELVRYFLSIGANNISWIYDDLDFYEDIYGIDTINLLTEQIKK